MYMDYNVYHNFFKIIIKTNINRPSLHRMLIKASGASKDIVALSEFLI